MKWRNEWISDAGEVDDAADDDDDDDVDGTDNKRGDVDDDDNDAEAEYSKLRNVWDMDIMVRISESKKGEIWRCTIETETCIRLWSRSRHYAGKSCEKDGWAWTLICASERKTIWGAGHRAAEENANAEKALFQYMYRSSFAFYQAPTCKRAYIRWVRWNWRGTCRLQWGWLEVSLLFCFGGCNMVGGMIFFFGKWFGSVLYLIFLLVIFFGAELFPRAIMFCHFFHLLITKKKQTY